MEHVHTTAVQLLGAQSHSMLWYGHVCACSQQPHAQPGLAQPRQVLDFSQLLSQLLAKLLTAWPAALCLHLTAP